MFFMKEMILFITLLMLTGCVSAENAALVDSGKIGRVTVLHNLGNDELEELKEYILSGLQDFRNPPLFKFEYTPINDDINILTAYYDQHLKRVGEIENIVEIDGTKDKGRITLTLYHISQSILKHLDAYSRKLSGVKRTQSPEEVIPDPEEDGPREVDKNFGKDIRTKRTIGPKIDLNKEYTLPSLPR